MATTNSGLRHRHHNHRQHTLIYDEDTDNFDSLFTNNSDDDDHDPINPKNSKTTVRKLPRKLHQRQQGTIPVGKSLPVNIPSYGDRVDDDGGGGDEWLPPHEYLARIRSASLSVHEGVGRTLKGRDLSRLRNAIWKQTGFELD